MPYDVFALAAAACWAFGSLLSVEASRHLGAFSYTRWRMLLVAAMLWATTLVLNGVQTPSFTHFGTMALSGLIGIFIGDTALFSAMNRLGPRRAGILFATHAIFSALLGFAVFGERMSAQALAGAALTISGVMIAILFGQRKTDNHAWETNQGHPGIGIVLGLVAALGRPSAPWSPNPPWPTAWTRSKRRPYAFPWPAPPTSACCGSGSRWLSPSAAPPYPC